MTNLDSILKSRDITFSTKVHLVKAMIFPVVMYGCESWTVKKAECWRIDAFEHQLVVLNWCFWTSILNINWLFWIDAFEHQLVVLNHQLVMLEKTLESPLDCKEIQPVHPKGDQSWVFIGRIYAEAETPILWPPHAKSWLIGKDLDAGRDRGQEEKETTEDEMARWRHWLSGHGFG